MSDKENPSTRTPVSYTHLGEGILVGIVDSGVDYFHPDFRNEDGSSRILRLWDQSVNGNPPESYVTGTEYTKEEIDKALALEETEGRRLVPSRDFSGHGTAAVSYTHLDVYKRQVYMQQEQWQ